MNEEELKAKEEELNKREEELNKRDDELKEREEALKDSNEDASALVDKVKKEYEERIKKLTEKYDKRINERDNVIKQLLEGEGANTSKPSLIDKINARRSAQLKKW